LCLNLKICCFPPSRIVILCEHKITEIVFSLPFLFNSHSSRGKIKVKQIKSGYVCAGFESFSNLLHRFMIGQSTTKESRFDNHFSRDDVANMLSQVTTGFLHSFGQDFAGRKKIHKYVEKEKKVYQQLHDEVFLSKNRIYVDSGGYQASIGSISKSETENLIRLYYEFLHETHHLVDRAFLLDLPPGDNCVIFENWDDVYRLNTKTYNMAADLPEEIRKKMVYIHHFRTPMQWKIFKKIKDENELFNKFNYFATGGIVSNLKNDAVIPCILYVIPLVVLLNDCLKYGRKKLEFHILGGANFRDMFFYEMFMKHVKEVHDIDLEITFDSSGLYKSLMLGRTLYIYDEHSNTIKKTDIRSNKMKMRFYNADCTLEEYLLFKLNSMAEKFNFKSLSYLKSIYCEETDTLWDEVRAYAMLYMIDFYSEAQTIIRDYVNSGVYDIYKSGDLASFNASNIAFITYLNSGKMTKKQIIKTTVLAKSLDILTELDESYCEYIVNNFLMKDEILKLNDDYNVLLF